MSHCSRSSKQPAAKPTVQELEQRVLELSGLKIDEELFVYDVPIEVKGKTYTIHTLRCGDGNTEDLVLLHGYAGAAALYYPMLADLSKKFRVFSFDFIGMGLSSKEKFECETPEETIDFLVTSIDKWREAVGLETFHLAGHSFGGYVSCQYTLFHQERVKKLSLLSPIGITKHETEPTFDELAKKFGFFKRFIFKIVLKIFQKAWDNKTTPPRFIQGNPRLGNMLVNNYVYKRFGLKKHEAGILKDYLWEMLNLPEGSEIAIHYVLKPPFAAARIPLEDIITEQIHVPVDCYFGEIDYMDMTGAKRIDSKKVKTNFALKTVPKAAHQLTIQNPKPLSEEIIRSALV